VTTRTLWTGVLEFVVDGVLDVDVEIADHDVAVVEVVVVVVAIEPEAQKIARF
jgi:hypothetical protein